MGAIISNLLLIGLALAVLAVSSGPELQPPAPFSPQAPPIAPVPFSARFVAPDRIGVRTSRLANVLEIPVAVGDRVVKGQPLAVLRDVAVVEKRLAASEQLRRLQADIVEAEARSSAAWQAASRARAETVSRMESEYQAAFKDFELRQKLFDEGLLARVEYERRKQDMESRRLELKAARESLAVLSVREVPDEPKSLADARRSLGRFEALADTFVLSAPRDAVVVKIGVSPGETPNRGAVLMLLEEDRPGVPTASGLPETSSPGAARSGRLAMRSWRP